MYIRKKAERENNCYPFNKFKLLFIGLSKSHVRLKEKKTLHAGSIVRMINKVVKEININYTLQLT